LIPWIGEEGRSREEHDGWFRGPSLDPRGGMIFAFQYQYKALLVNTFKEPGWAYDGMNSAGKQPIGSMREEP
jgi:hypothetical protein